MPGDIYQYGGASIQQFNIIDFSWLPDNRHIVYQWANPKDESRYIAIADVISRKVTKQAMSPIRRRAYELDNTSADSKYVAGLSRSSDSIEFWSVPNLKPVGDPIKVSMKGCYYLSDIYMYRKPELFDGLNCAIWSPVGNWVAYTVDKSDTEHSLVWRELESGKLVEKTIASADNLYISWSPDGQYILLESANELNTVPHPDPHLAIYRLDGSLYDEFDVWEFTHDVEGWSAEKQHLFYYSPDDVAATVYDFKTKKHIKLQKGITTDQIIEQHSGIWEMVINVFKGKYWLTQWTEQNKTFAGVFDVDSGLNLFTYRFTNENEILRYDAHYLYWSPVGTAIIQTHQNGEGNGIVWWTLGDTTPHKQSFPSFVSDGGYSPDNQWLLLTEPIYDASYDYPNVYAVNLQTGQYRAFWENHDQFGYRLTDDLSRSISPDGHTIVQWTAQNRYSTDKIEVNFADLNSDWSRTVDSLGANSKVHMFSKHWAEAKDSHGWNWAWSPDGTKAAFAYGIGQDKSRKEQFNLDLYTNRGELIRRYENFVETSNLDWVECPSK